MPKFKKKPVEIEAVLFTGENWTEVNQFVGKTFEVDGEFHWGFIPVHENEDHVVAEVWDKLHDTWVGVKAGQWIIKGVQGEFYPCDPDVFEVTYNKVDEDSNYLVIGPECFSNEERTVISWKGENFYRACDILVHNYPDGGASHCVKRVNHPGKTHEDYNGLTREED